MPKVIHSLQLHISHQMRSYSCQDHLTIELYLFFGQLGITAIWEERAQIPLIKYRVTQKEIQSLQVHISHQMRPYASVRALRELSYTCFTDTRVLGNLGKLGPNTQNHVQGHLKSNPKSSAPGFTSNQTLPQYQGTLWVKLYLLHRYSSLGAIWGKWTQIPHIIHRDT